MNYLTGGMFLCEGDGGYKRGGHICAFQRGYDDGRRGTKWPGRDAWELPGHRPAYRQGVMRGEADRTKVRGEGAVR